MRFHRFEGVGEQNIAVVFHFFFGQNGQTFQIDFQI